MDSGICANVPFMLGDIDLAGKFVLEGKRMPLAGFMLLWPFACGEGEYEQNH